VVTTGAIGLAGGALAACAPAAGSSGSAPESKEPVALSFLSWRPPAMAQFAPYWQEYQRKHNVTLAVDDSGDGNQEKLTTMFASDTAPDLFDANTRNQPSMYNSGFVLEISKYLSRDRVPLDKDWALLGIERWRSKTYGVPYWAEPFGIYYNKSLFKKKGVEDPWERGKNKGDWSVEEMVEAARQINDPAKDIWGLDWGYMDYHGIGPLIWTHGVSHLQYDPSITFQLQLPEVLQAHTMAIDWSMRQRFNITADLPEATASAGRIHGGRKGISSGGVNRFSQGNIGIHYRSVNDWRRMWPVVNGAFEWDMLPIPSQNGKPGASWSAGHPVCAAATTRHPEASWAFMHWLMGDEFQGVLAEQQFLVPAKKRHQPRFFRPPEGLKYQHPGVFANVYKRPYGIIWTHFNAAENATTWANEIKKVFSGEVGMQGGLRDMERVLNAQIDYGGGENPFKGVRWPIQPK
jgi:ABC-type glycerol-3-phosphate transport system substrate-binding protein